MSTEWREALRQAHKALQAGDARVARRWAEHAAALAPEEELPWLVLAALASPRASLEYIKRALELNPQSRQARAAMRWAVRRWRRSQQPVSRRPRLHVTPLTPQALQRRVFPLPWAFALMLVAVLTYLWFSTPRFSLAGGATTPLALAQAEAHKATRTPTPTATFTPTPTFTPSPTPTNTPTPTPTLTPSITPSPPPTNTPAPTQPPPPTQPSAANPPAPAGGNRWIDVDLSEQRLYAYQGEQVVRSFLVSTGTWQYPTVTGQYHIYVKYRFTDMAGPGYYLPDVPYTMYFYKGYGIHGTYWHNNFGTPMSHGCVNMTIDDAAWLFNWASVGTLVNVHP